MKEVPAKTKQSNSKPPEVVKAESMLGAQVAKAVEGGLAYFGTEAIVESLLYILELD